MSYRKIWSDHNGPIPVDDSGKSYEIHHIDGDHNNNDISNLMLVSIQEHYNIHFSQGDFAACQAILRRMEFQYPENYREMCSVLAKLRVKTGTHNFQGERNNIHQRVKDGRHRQHLNNINKKMLSEGRHSFQKRPDGSSLSLDRVKNGTHNFTPERCKIAYELSAIKQIEMIANGTHHSKIERECPNCGHIGYGNAMKRWHFKNCKGKINKDQKPHNKNTG